MLWLLPAFPVLAALVPVSLGRRLSRPALAGMAVTVMLITLALAIAATAADWSAAWHWSTLLRLTARLDPLSGTMAVLVPLVGLPVVLFAALHEAGPGLSRLVALLVFFVGAMELLVIADDLLTLIVGWEMVGVCSWALIAHHWRDGRSTRDAATAFLVTRLGDLGLFLAAMVTFANTDAFTFAALGTLSGGALELAVLGLVTAAAAKSAQLPFSFWLFNAMSGPSSVSALLHAATMVAAGAYLMARLHPMLNQVGWFGPAVMSMGLTTALAGGLVALLQSHVKKVLAASTSAHYGFMFVAVGAGYPAVAMLHLVMHALFKAPLFLAAGIVAAARHTHLLALLGQGRRLPVTAGLALCASLALAGVPPLGAAWTKEMTGAAAGHHGAGLALGLLLAGSLSAAYAARWQVLALGPGEIARSTESRSPGIWVLVALATPVVLTLASALSWLPHTHQALGAWFHTHLPEPPAWERTAMLVLLFPSLYAGWWLARTNPHLGRRTRSAAAADWFGLPAVAQLGARPVLSLAGAAARFDDAVLDRWVTALATGTASVGQFSSRTDDHVLDGAVRALAKLGVQLAARGRAMAEAVADGAVEGMARLIYSAGSDTAALETGSAHHYLAWMAVGAAVLASVILLA